MDAQDPTDSLPSSDYGETEEEIVMCAVKSLWGASKMFLLVGNGSYLNQGCEAIVRGTLQILRHTFGNRKVVNLYRTTDKGDFRNFSMLDYKLENIPVAPPRRWSYRWLLARAIRSSAIMQSTRKYNSLAAFHANTSEAVLSIGGDNYTLDYAVPQRFIDMDRMITRKSVPLVIWGASVGPFDKNPNFAQAMHAHLRDDVTAIFVREKESLDYLNSKSISANVYYMPDPAFLMSAENIEVDTLGFEVPDSAIGVNLSPIMANYITNGDQAAWKALALKIITLIRNKCGRPIILIPHVTIPGVSDHTFMKEAVWDQMSSTKDIYLLPKGMNAAQTKGVISKLSCLIASRTHATIASFSSCVPTVSLAYSIKAYGINDRLFGHTDYVISAKQLRAEEIAERTKTVLRENDGIRKHLKDVIPAVQKDALEAGLVLKKIIGG